MTSEYMRAWRERNREKIREYNRAYNKQYRTEHGYGNEKRWVAENPLKVSAQRKAQRAKRLGVLVQEECDLCREKDTVMHHEDYSKPLEVRWLCKVHHREVHYGSPKM